jgi:hypothetical protein
MMPYWPLESHDARYCDAMSSPLVQTLIGGGLAIVGGLLAASWQTARADNVAQIIRRDERYESALIELNARRAEAAQHFDDLLDHWHSSASLIISGSAIVDAHLMTTMWPIANLRPSAGPTRRSSLETSKRFTWLRATRLTKSATDLFAINNSAKHSWLRRVPASAWRAVTICKRKALP